MAALVTLAVVLFVLTVSVLINGYTLMVLWGWFMVPIFKLPALNLAEAIGVSLVIGFMIIKVASGDSEKSSDLFESLRHPHVALRRNSRTAARATIKTLITCGLFLLIGYITKGYL